MTRSEDGEPHPVVLGVLTVMVFLLPLGAVVVLGERVLALLT
jgi:hypothetical protein